MAERVNLPRPVKVGRRTISSVVVRRPDGRDRAVLGEALMIVADRPDHPEDIARANRIVAAHLSSLGLDALSVEDASTLQPIADLVFRFITEE